METRRCPKCDASTTIPCENRTGEIAPIFFLPVGSRAWRVGVPMSPGLTACWSCGHVWGHVAPAELRGFIEKFGKKLAQQHRISAELGPGHGVPDVPEALEAAHEVAEIDALVLFGKHSEAARQLRERTQKTWDEALGAIRCWPDLERNAKLALLGWSPKKKTDSDGDDLQQNPMRDRLLDG
jgi:hypothetical protein